MKNNVNYRMKNQFQHLFNSQQAYFLKELSDSPIKKRLKKLKSLHNWIKKNEKLICEEIYKDFET